MSDSLTARLRRLAEALPAGGAVVFTRDDLLDLVQSAEVAGDPGDGDLTCADVAQLLGCSESAVRRLLEGGRMVGYKLSAGPRGPWRVPRASVRQFRAAQHDDQNAGPDRPPDLGRWRRIRRAEA